MATQDSSGTSRDNGSPKQTPAENQPQSTVARSTTPAQNDMPVENEVTQPVRNFTRLVPKRMRWAAPSRLVASLHKIRLTGTAADDTVPAAVATAPVMSTPAGKSGKGRRKAKKDRLQDWDTWSKFRLWRHTRPFWGSILMLLSALILLLPTLPLLQFAFIVNLFWASILIGALLLTMALIQLFAPLYCVVTGSVGIVLSLVSFLTNNFGGFLLGMLLGVIGGALSLSWRPVKRSRLVATRSTATHS